MNTKTYKYILLLFWVLFVSACNTSRLDSAENRSGESSVNALRPLGVIAEDYQALAKKQGVYQPFRTLNVLPAQVDLSGDLPPVGDQGFQNSCVAWAVGYAAKTYQESKEEGWDLNESAHQFSPAWIYNQINGGRDSGSLISDALNLITAQGVDTLAGFPYDAANYTRQPDFASLKRAARYRIQGWQALPTNVQEIKKVLAAGEVVVISLGVYPDFDSLSEKNQVYESISGNPRGKHALVIVGYDDDKLDANGQRGAFKMLNSWGTGWGLEGFGWISYQLIGNYNDVVDNPAGFYAWKLTDKVNTEPQLVAGFRNPLNSSQVTGTVPITIEAFATSAIEKVTYWVLEPGSESEILLGEVLNGVSNAEGFLFTYPWQSFATNKNGFYYLRAEVKTETGQSLELKNWVFVLNEAPEVTLVNPLPGQVLNGQVKVQVQISDPYERGIFVKRLILIIDEKWEYVANYSALQYEYNWDSNQSAEGEHLIKVIVEWDSQYISSVTKELTVRVQNNQDETPPVVAIKSPSAGYWAAFVSGTAQITGTVSDDTAVSELSLKVVKSGVTGDTGNVPALVPFNNNNWSYVLDTRQLTNYTTYEVQVQAKDQAGNLSLLARLKIFVMNY